MKTYFPEEFAERKVTNDRELEEFAKWVWNLKKKQQNCVL